MLLTNYEKFSNTDPNFPVTFHAYDIPKTVSLGFSLHWHEHLEILYFKSGEACITLNNQQITAKKGDIIVINSNVIHSMPLKPACCSYQCLILYKYFCDSSFIPIGELSFCEKIADNRISDIFDIISYEMSQKKPYYKSSVKANATSLLVLLAREFVSSNMTITSKAESQKIKMVKKAINFLSSNYTQPVKMEGLADYVGFNKYYLCHSFKEVTGQTVMDYINGLRCSHAKRLLNVGECNISESAVRSGFTNLSYFTRTYKKYIGVLPSKDLKYQELRKIEIQMPFEVIQILERIHQNNHEAYIVGGCVRDSLLSLTPHDWDICTNALPHQIIELFKDKTVIETGVKHGTVTIIWGGQYEITTYRTDGEYLDNRHPNEVCFVKSLNEDLSRRDFTINAVAYNDQEGLIDYFNGQEDLNSKLIRCVGDPDKRFNEDSLRIMRALRFASTYGFEMETSTAVSLKQNSNLLCNIALERISTELCKLLCGKYAYEILYDYVDVLSVFIPEIKDMMGFEQNNPYHHLDVWKHTILSVKNAPDDIVVKLAMLFHDIGKPHCRTVDENGMYHFYGHGQLSCDVSSMVLKRLKFDNETIINVKKLVLYHDADIAPTAKSIKRWLNKLGEVTLRRLINVKTADVLAQSGLDRQERLMDLQNISLLIDKIIEENECFSLKELAINGRDLIEIGITSGVQIGNVLNWLMDLVIDEKLHNDREELLETAKKLINK